MNYLDYIKTELLILIPVLYFIGIGFKKSKMPNKWIPLSIGLIAILLSAFWIIATSEINGIKDAAAAAFSAITQGVLVAGGSVYANQLYIQSKKEE